MTSRAGQALAAAIGEVGDGLSPEAWDVLADPDAAIAAIEQEVRDDIRARLGNPYEWNPGYCPWCDKTMLTEGHAADCLFAAISSSSATETQDGLPDANRVGGYSAYGEPYAEDAYDSATETQDENPSCLMCKGTGRLPFMGESRACGTCGGSGRMFPVATETQDGERLRYAEADELQRRLAAPTPDDRNREEFAQAAEPIVRWYMEHVADPEVVAKWAGLRASGGTE